MKIKLKSCSLRLRVFIYYQTSLVIFNFPHTSRELFDGILYLFQRYLGDGLLDLLDKLKAIRVFSFGEFSFYLVPKKIVERIEIWTVWWPAVGFDERDSMILEGLQRLFASVTRRTILLKAN